jgi:hypothetical protein
MSDSTESRLIKHTEFLAFQNALEPDYNEDFTRITKEVESLKREGPGMIADRRDEEAEEWV